MIEKMLATEFIIIVACGLAVLFGCVLGSERLNTFNLFDYIGCAGLFGGPLTLVAMVVTAICGIWVKP